MMTMSEINAIETATSSTDPRAILEAVKACSLDSANCSTRSAIWACAMTIAFGPTHLHPSYTDEHGHPTPETVAKFPQIREAERAARARIPHLLAQARREARA